MTSSRNTYTVPMGMTYEQLLAVVDATPRGVERLHLCKPWFGSPSGYEVIAVERVQ